MIIYSFYMNCVFCSIEIIMFQQFMNKPAGVAATGEPVRTQGVQHVPYVDVRVPGFCRASGTHLFYERRGVEVSFVFYLQGGYSLQNWNYFV